MNESLDLEINWRDFIHSDVKISMGKPVIKDTRMSVEFVLSLFANGWSKNKIMENYPHLTENGIKAALSFASECIEDVKISNQPK